MGKEIMYKSQVEFMLQAKLRKSAEMSAEKKSIKALLENRPNHFCVTGINIIHQNGKAVSVEYSAKDNKNDKHYKRHKAGIRVTEDMIEILEVVNT